MVDFKDYTRKMERTLEVLQEEFGAVRAGRAHARAHRPRQPPQAARAPRPSSQHSRREVFTFLSRARISSGPYKGVMFSM